MRARPFLRYAMQANIGRVALMAKQAFKRGM